MREGGFDPSSGHRLHSALALAGAMEIDGVEQAPDGVVVRFAPGGEARRIAFSALSRMRADRTLTITASG